MKTLYLLVGVGLCSFSASNKLILHKKEDFFFSQLQLSSSLEVLTLNGITESMTPGSCLQNFVCLCVYLEKVYITFIRSP